MKNYYFKYMVENSYSETLYYNSKLEAFRNANNESDRVYLAIFSKCNKHLEPLNDVRIYRNTKDIKKLKAQLKVVYLAHQLVETFKK